MTGNREEILSAAGNRWSLVPFTAKLKDVLFSDEMSRVVIIGLPYKAQF